MIAREVYLEFAKRNEVPMVLLYDYYQKFNTRPNLSMSLEEFENYFIQYLLNFAVNLESQRAYFDSLYSVTTVYDKKGNFITIY